MMKRISIALILTLVLSAVVIGQSQIKNIYNTINLGVTANRDSVIVLFPQIFGTNKPGVDGYFSVTILPDTIGSVTGLDSLSIWCRKLQKTEGGIYVMDRVDSVLCVSQLSWTPPANPAIPKNCYSYEITSALGPCHGLVVFARYKSETAGDSITVPIWVTVQ